MRKRSKKFIKPQSRGMRFRLRRPKIFGRYPLVVVPLVTFGVLLLVFAAAVVALTGGHPEALRKSDSRIVIVSHDKQQQTVPTRAKTVGALLKKLNITLNQGDVVEPSAATPINQDDFRINVYRATPIEIIDGTRKTFTFSAATTTRSIAKQAGVDVYPEDNLALVPTTNFVAQGAVAQQLVIDRAVPVNLNLYGTQVVVRTHARTVGELLAEKHIKVSGDDSVQPTADTPLTDNSQIFLIHKGTQIVTESQDIPMPMQTIQDSSLSYGVSAIRQQGSPGKQLVTYQVNLQNGKEVGRTVIQTVVTQQPVTQIVAQGTNLSGIKGDMALAGISPSDYQFADYIITRESGWCTTKWQGDIGSCPAYHGTPGPGLGYGLCQATPGSKMGSAGSDWATNPVTQLIWCNGYAVKTYGGWANAAAHWQAYHNW